MNVISLTIPDLCRFLTNPSVAINILQRGVGRPTVTVKIIEKIRLWSHAPLHAKPIENIPPSQIVIQKLGTRLGQNPIGAFSFGYSVGLLEFYGLNTPQNSFSSLKEAL